MIEEQEEMKNYQNTKKLPEYKIQENSQRLYDEAKRRTFIRNKKLREKNNNNNITSFNDEEDASKYMKSLKSDYYNFNGNSETNSNFFSINNNEINNLNNLNVNEGFSHKSVGKNNELQRFNRVNPNDFKINRTRGNTKKQIRKSNRDYYYPITDSIKLVNNFTFKSNTNSNQNSNQNSNSLKKYDDFKRKRIENNDFLNQRINITTQYPHDIYNNNNNNYNYNINNYNVIKNNNNRNENEDIENNNYNNKRDNIVDNYLYNYCVNRYFDKN